MAVNIGPRIGIDGEKEYRKQIAQIIQETKTLKSEYEKLSSTMDHGKTSLKQNAEQHRILRQEIEAQEKRVQELSEMVRKSADKYGEADTKTLKWKQALNEANTELNQMRQELRDLPNRIQLIGQKMEAMGRKIKGVGDSISRVGDTLTTHLTAPIAASATVSVKKFAEVNKTMTLTNKIMGNTADQADVLEGAMKSAAQKSIFGMSDAAQAALNFARAGLKAEEAAEILAPSMNLAAGAGGDLDTVSAGLVATINGFGGSFSEANKYANIFSKAATNSALEINSLSESMSIASPVFKAAGKNVEDAALYMGIMANSGIDADTAANALKTGLARIASPAKQGAVALKKLGIEIFDSDGKMKDSVEVQRILHDSFADLSEQEQIAAASAIFGKNQMSNWLALINTAPSDVQELSSELSTTTDAVSEMSDAMMSGFGGSIEKLKSSLDVAASSFGEALAPTISKVADQIQRAVDWFNSLDESQQQQIAKAALMVAAAGPVISIFGRMTSGIGSMVSAGGNLTQGIGSLTNLLGGAGGLAGAASGAASGVGAVGGAAAGIAVPVAIAVGAVALLSGAFVTAYKNDEEFAGEVKTAWNGIGTEITEIITTLKPAWEKFSSIISPIFVAELENIRQELDNFQRKAQGFIDVVGGIFNGDLGRVLKGAEELFSAFGNRSENKFKIIADTIENIFEKMDIQLPDIKLPHFKITGTNRWGLPSFDIDWYAKAMQNGMRLTSPTIFGAANGKLMAGGEAGNEWVIGERSLMGMIRGAVRSAYVPGGGNEVNIGGTTIIINAAEGQDVQEIADRVDEIIDARLRQAEAAWA